jgi:hypothetical protein
MLIHRALRFGGLSGVGVVGKKNTVGGAKSALEKQKAVRAARFATRSK